MTRVFGERTANATGNVADSVGLPRDGAGHRHLLKDASATPLIPRSWSTTYFFLLFVGFPELDATYVPSRLDTARYFENLGNISRQPCLVVTRNEEVLFECLIHFCISTLGR